MPMTFLMGAVGVAEPAIVTTTILRSIYPSARPLRNCPACIDKHCFGVRIGAPQLGRPTTPFDLSQVTREQTGDSKSQHALEAPSSSTWQGPCRVSGEYVLRYAEPSFSMSKIAFYHIG